MSDFDPNNLPEFGKLAAPERLVREVERQGTQLLQRQESSRVARSLRLLAVDAGLAAFCIGQLLWCARTVGFLP